MSKAVANGHLAIAQWLYTVKDERCSAEAANEAARNGHLEVLEWLDANHVFPCSSATMDWAALYGHLEVVKWLHRTHHECCSPNAMGMAASYGHLELAQWLYGNVHRKCQSYVLSMSAMSAAEAGRVDVLEWMHEHFPCSFSNFAMDAAAASGKMDVITWLHNHRSEGCSKLAAYNAAKNGHLEVLKWLHMHYPSTLDPGIEGISSLLDRAAENGHLEVVRWLHDTCPALSACDAMHNAATHGHLDIFLYLLEHRAEGFSVGAWYNTQDIDVMCCFAADVGEERRPNRATSDQLKTLRNVFERRPSFVRYCLQCLTLIACSTGNVSTLEWVSQFGIKLHSRFPVQRAVNCGGLKMLQWLGENGFDIMDPDLLTKAEVAPWMVLHGYVAHSLELIKSAGSKFNTDRRTRDLRWLVEQGPPLDLPTARSLVLDDRRIEIAWWVSEENRRHLVLEALQKGDRDVVWWVLSHTSFENKSARGSIRDAIQHSPHDTQQWFVDSMSEVEACRWCFSRPNKRWHHESEDQSVSRTKRKKME